jgi:hypothetical protein
VRFQATDITRKFVEALNIKFQGRDTPIGTIEFVVVDGGRIRGRNFDKIVLPNLGGSHDGSDVHAFIERQTGKLYRAATGETPVVDPRYDLSLVEDFSIAVGLADPYGNYLHRNYARRIYAGSI